MINYSYSTSPLNIPLLYPNNLHFITPLHIPTRPTSHTSPTYIYTAYISLIPHVYLHSLHVINPTYTYTAYISLIPYILIPYRYLHILHLIYALHILIHPTSH